MKFGLNKPCAKCPFRSDIRPYLRAGRVEDIHDGLRAGGTFACHATVDYDAQDSEDCDASHVPTDGEHFCAGALILMEKEFEGQGGCMANQMVRFGTRFSGFNPDALDMDAPVFDSFDDMVSAQEEE
jgi:hypothetical protein